MIKAWGATYTSNLDIYCNKLLILDSSQTIEGISFKLPILKSPFACLLYINFDQNITQHQVTKELQRLLYPRILI